MKQPYIAFIGAGNMASAIIGGLIKQGISTQKLEACAPSDQTRARIKQQFGICVSEDNMQAASRADIVILSVKPQIIKSVAQQIAPHLKNGSLVISIAAGITCTHLTNWLTSDNQGQCTFGIIRAMPNTPSQIGLGASGLFANSDCSPSHKVQAQNIMSAVGKTVWVEDEKHIDTVTAISGSGPAYFFLIFESMINEGIAQGLSYEDAKTLTLQTALGAASLAQQSTVEVATLRQQVTSPKGTTEKAIQTFEEHKLGDIFSKAMQACVKRAQALSKA